MPNHVFNNIKVTGSEEAITAFKEKAHFDEREFSYWHFVTPPAEALTSGEYWATRGYVKGEETGFTPNNWYEFNTREWGTKWDSYDIDVQIAPKSFFASFSSAWSPPMPVFQAMVEQHPELEFEFYWCEEQDWGGEAIGAGGHFSIVKEWDIPDSHADYVALGWEGRCSCESEDDQEYWYDDCPRQSSDDDAGIDD